jgi:hypothetical protein
MIHDMRPAVMNAIRRGINRRGAVTALLAGLPFASLGAEQADATRSQRHGTRSAKSERKRKKKARGSGWTTGSSGASRGARPDRTQSDHLRAPRAGTHVSGGGEYPQQSVLCGLQPGGNCGVRRIRG